MNTRGLMELVVLGIGYEMKILPPTIYAVLVLMTVITTVMTMPMVHLINVFIRMKERKRDASRLLISRQELRCSSPLVVLPRGLRCCI